MSRRVYSEDEKAAALAVLRACGGNMSEASRKTGVARGTLRGWADNAPDVARQIRQDKQNGLASMFREVAETAVGLELRALRHLESASDAELVDHLAILNRVSGTATDKLQLLTGGPTERIVTEVVIDLGEEVSDE